MCIINNTYQFIYVHIPKCGGTSVTRTLSPLTTMFDLEIGGTPYGEKFQHIFSPRFRIFKHAVAREIRAHVGVQMWSRYYTFATVRNPYARTYSTFKYLRQHSNEHKVMEDYETFNDFVMGDIWDTPGPEMLLRPQTVWVTLRPEDKTLYCDQVFKLEELDQRFDEIAERLGAPEEFRRAGLSRDNVSKAPPSPPALCAEAIERIKTRYADDFSLFDYDPEDIPFPVVG